MEQGIRYSYLGFTMVVLVGGFLYGGYWIDQRFETDPWGTLIGLGLGILFGFGYFVLEMVRLVQEGQKKHDRGDENES